MHESLTESLQLAGTVISVSHHCEIGIHTGIPAAVTLDSVSGIIILDVIALAGRANEGTGTAAQASLRKSCPLIGVEQFHQLVSAEGICGQIFQRQLAK